nr:hypothetical protein [Zobellella maritima]
MDCLRQLRQVADQFDLAILTRVSQPEALNRAAELADALLICAQDAHNADLLSAAGRCTRPILLEQPVGTDVDAWLVRAEQILAQGNQQVALLDRQQLPLPQLLTLQQSTHLPLISVLQAGELLPAMASALKGAGVQGFCLPLTADSEEIQSDWQPLQQLAHQLYQE